MSELEVNHVRRVHSLVQNCLKSNGSNRLANPIIQSWARCLNEYDLRPDSSEEFAVVNRTELQDRQERLADVLEVAKIEMANIYQQLAGSGYAIMLTDRDGVVLNYFGDPSFTHAASKTGLVEGAIWTERLQGTNGMGTCLSEKRPIVIHKDEHYLVRNIGITCAAAPIFNHLGEIVAVLDASGESRLAQQHTLVLVNMSVQMIENRVFLHQFRHEYIVHFHSRPEFIGTLNEGVIAFNAEGTVLGATGTALFHLDMPNPAAIRGLNIAELFNATLPALIDSSIKKAFQPIPLFEVKRGGRFYAVARSPDASTRSLRTPDRTRSTHARDMVALESSRTPLDALQFGDVTMEANIKSAKRVVERDVPILLYGETGTGKEMFAKAVHQSGSRAHKPFVAINCASIPESLIESELFGYKSGAFTGASKEGQRGKLFQANGGTLFLDEIGDMPITLQARLLRVLEEREVLPLGGEASIKLDIRVISATHCDLAEKIRAHEFREDLFYRLQGITLSMPALRERGDKRALIKHVLAVECSEEEQVEMDEELLGMLTHYRWPGNVRELRNMLRTMVALRESDLLTVDDLPIGFAGTTLQCVKACEPAVGSASKLNPLENAERDALVQELESHHWNITTVSRNLKISRNTLYRKMQRLGISDLDKGLPH